MIEKTYIWFQKLEDWETVIMVEVALVKTPTDRYGITVKKAKKYIWFRHDEKDILADNVDPYEITSILESNFISYI